MPKNFLMFASESVPAANPVEMPIEPPASDRESLRILIIGSRRGVTGTIQTLHRLRFAEVREWSPLLPAPNSGEVMSILTRYVMPE
ncbi:MAG: peptide ABC transporter substrate-binding protein [Oscillatoriales cyanobacterium C42_A2020_001]|nr:peptide ABC transporter substrate-binding protein [Leptolyngbyaceae cyanobacterium C42_A2020_001]